MLSKTFLITGNEGYDFFKNDKNLHTYGVFHTSGKNTITRIVKYVFTQLKLTKNLVTVSKNIDIWIFYFCGDGLLIPMLAAKLLHKKVILGFPSSSSIVYQYTNANLAKPLEVVSRINCELSDRIIVYSRDVISDWGLNRFKNKIRIAHEHVVDSNVFRITKAYQDRPVAVGFIGRFSREKGILNFVHALPRILESMPRMSFLIIGEGLLKDEINEDLVKSNVSKNVKVSGWMAHNDLPDCLNNIQLLVVPSYTETGPMIALEAMACGTPVLGTKVGQLATILEDGKTGFVLENNSPETIAENIIRVMDTQTVKEIIKNARELIESRYNFNSISTQYAKIVEELVNR